MPKPRLLIFVVAYNAETTITSVVRRIPCELSEHYDVNILIIDDASRDATFARSYILSKAADAPFPIHALYNPVNQGYGGNQKLGYRYAIQNGYDFVALLHGDGQYAPECLPKLLEPLRDHQAGAVFGSRMLTRTGALKGGMPLYKFAGNRILTWIENKLLRAALSEFHSGYRIYSVRALESIPFECNSNDFHFDTEIIIQLLIARIPIRELPIPTFYGDEVCYVNGLKYAANVVKAAVKARLQEWSLFYDRRFDCAPTSGSSPYQLKLGYPSPHTLAQDRVPPGSRVLDLGCGGGSLGALLKQDRGCSVTGVDLKPLPGGNRLDEFCVHDLNSGVPLAAQQPYDRVLLLDVIGNLRRPENFLEDLRQALARSAGTEVLVSTANVACYITRAMLLLGQFNYSKRGILDLANSRLFTFASLRHALQTAGFDILETRGVPPPFPLAIGDNFASRALLALHEFLIRLSRGLFSYQIFMRVKPKPTVESLLSIAETQSSARAAALENVA
jgi:glycosyltransferase involved in cell wall biosynthesis